MTIIPQIRVALKALWLNKSRSILTMLGVIIGVSAVIMLVAIGDGLRILVNEQFESFGANNIFITPGEVFGEGGGFSGQATALANNPIRYEDVVRIERLRDYIDQVTVLSISQAQTSFKQFDETTTIAGVGPSYKEITNTLPAVGTFFTKSQAEKKDKVAVLGSAIANDLFGTIDPIGKTITINNQSFKVIGVAIEKGGGFGGPAFDEYIYIPIQTWFQTFDSQQIFRIIAQAKSEDKIQSAIAAIDAELAKRLEDDEYSVFEQSEILGIIDQILSGLTAGLGGIAAISLVVGGVGIMNIMLVSVTERTREIGLRKALGATPNMILVQFLIEAVFLSVFGGMIGVGFASIASFAISQFIPASVTPTAISLAFGVSVGVGILFGVYPARQASAASPIEALRYE